ncbi:50S ribosomal protein L13 [Candidatus Dependentiae bacterium]|nr:50S ribosomal protein L13 [Candidatus Dependentiae bacterium]
MKTYSAKPGDIVSKWFITDADGVILGRLASKIAMILMGKNKPIYSTHLDTGDNVIVINAKKIKVTGKKLEKKIYYRHTGYIGGLKEKTLAELLEQKPTEVIYHAVRLMLPKTRMGRQMLKKLHVYAESSHPHKAQQPENLDLK